MIGHGGRAHSLKTRIIAKHEFAGHWEYVLDEAIFTAPAHPQWGGAALLDAQGNLIGIGSLLVQQVVNGESHTRQHVRADRPARTRSSTPMVQTGRSPHPPRPWLGMSTEDPSGKLIVDRISPDGPAQPRRRQAGDLVLAVGGQRVHGLADFFRTVWQTRPGRGRGAAQLLARRRRASHHDQVGRPQQLFAQAEVALRRCSPHRSPR